MTSRIFILICSLIFISHIASAQVSFGVQAGPSIFNIINSDDSFEFPGYSLKDKPILGYYLALAVDIPIKNNFSIQSELSFIRKGETQKINITDISIYGIVGKIRSENRIEYIEIPVFAKYHFHFNEKIGLDLGMGISTAYLRKSSIWTKIKGGESSSYSTEISNDFVDGRKINRWDISPILDLSMPFQTKKGKANFGTRFSVDVNDIRAYENNSIERIKPKLYNWGMIFYVGYSFNKNDFKKKE